MRRECASVLRFSAALCEIVSVQNSILSVCRLITEGRYYLSEHQYLAEPQRRRETQAVIIVPAPSSVKTSLSRAFRFDPFIMCALRTPLRIR